MAESFVVNIAEKILEKIKALALEEVALAWNARAELQKLEGTISTIRALLLDAEEQQQQQQQLRHSAPSNRQLCDWLRKLKDVCYDADDLLDEVNVQALRQQLLSLSNATLWRKVSLFFSCSTNPLAIATQLGLKIKEIRLRLDAIASDRASFNLMILERPSPLDYSPASTKKKVVMTHSHSFERPSNIIGRNSDLDNITSLLTSYGGSSDDDDNVSVIPIVGIGGLGKTTLAKLAYNDDRIGAHFALRMWVCVSEEFDVKVLVENIIRSATRASCGDLDMDQLQTRLREILHNKKYLLVLDDVWNEHYGKWIELKNLLMDGAEGSKIVVTTRSHSVATIVGTVLPYWLGGLPHEDCFSLFVKWAFGDRQENPHPRLLEIGNEIVNKCQGVPLAVRTLGGLLYSKADERDWLYVRDNEMWQIEQKEDDILPALKLSYNQLPSHLKQCFAYCAIFPKNCRINGDLLIQLWMAQGLVHSLDGNQELEDVGMRYFKELWSRSFFQEVDDSDFTFVCGMHDLVHDLAVSVAHNDQFCTVSSKTQSIPKEIRHVSFSNNDWCEMEVPKSVLELKNVRTINFQYYEKRPSSSFIETCISNFKCLRVLDLTGSDCEILPSTVGDLKHLRYLDLSENRCIRVLPNSICRLQSLQSLVLFRCEALEDLPRDFKNLISLRFLTLTIKQVFLPEKAIGSLSSLRCLSITWCCNLRSLGEDIHHLSGLRTLCIMYCNSLVSLSSSLKCLTSLENLLLYNCPKLDLSLSEDDKWAGDNQGLKKLRVLRIRELPLLVTLPQWLLPQGWSVRGVGTLEYLTIFGCTNLIELPKWLGNLTSLQKLRILSCPKVKSLPDSIDRLTALRLLKIDKCPELSIRCAPTTGEDWNKISHVSEIYLDNRRI